MLHKTTAVKRYASDILHGVKVDAIKVMFARVSYSYIVHMHTYMAE